MLGFWCGLGVYLDSMFVLTLAGMLVGGSLAARRVQGLTLAHGLALIVAFLVGAAPRVIGQWVEPHDAYHEQFTWSLDTRLLADHSKILFCDCLPRLVAGHRLPGLEADPDPALLGMGAPIQRKAAGRDGWHLWVWLLVLLAIGYFAGSLIALVRAGWKGNAVCKRTVAAGLAGTVAAVVTAFLINRNIFNSDNYRYLVLLLVPWPLGSGLVLRNSFCRSATARLVVCAVAILLSALYTSDAAAWYRHLGWLDDSFRPVQGRVNDPAVAWLRDHRQVRTIYGSYWDVYRLSFLSGGELKGVPFPIFPNRFPEWSAGLPEGRPETLLVRRSPEAQHFLNSALHQGGRVLYREGGLVIVHWPWTRAGTTAIRQGQSG